MGGSSAAEVWAPGPGVLQAQHRVPGASQGEPCAGTGGWGGGGVGGRCAGPAAAGRAALGAEALVGWWHLRTGLLGSLLSQPPSIPSPPSLSGLVLMDLLCDMNSDHMGQAKGSQVSKKTGQATRDRGRFKDRSRGNLKNNKQTNVLQML